MISGCSVGVKDSLQSLQDKEANLKADLSQAQRELVNDTQELHKAEQSLQQAKKAARQLIKNAESILQAEKRSRNYSHRTVKKIKAALQQVQHDIKAHPSQVRAYVKRHPMKAAGIE